MKKSLFSLICCIGLVQASQSLAAGCVVGGTDFDTESTLFNPTLSNDANGWFSENVADLLDAQCKAKCQYNEEAYKAIHVGLQSNIISSAGSTAVSWEIGAGKNPSGDDKSFVGIVANPRTISPYLSESKDGNMLVAYGNGSNVNILTYTVSGLKGPTATLKANVYNLFSEENIKEAFIAQNTDSQTGDLVPQSKWENSIKATAAIGFTLNYPGTGKPTFNGNPPGVSVSSGIKSASASITAIGSSDELELTANVVDGSVTFVFKTTSAAAPIGIDNIRIEGEIAPKIQVTKKLPVCAGQPVKIRLKDSYPADTKYLWTGGSSDEPNNKNTYSITPKEIGQSYPVSCTVTLPGCSASKATETITTKECCTQEVDGKTVPMANISVFYDDFGTFINDDLYEYSDAKGNTYQVPVDRSMGWPQPKVVTLQAGANVPVLKPSIDAALKEEDKNDRPQYAIVRDNPYNPGVSGDFNEPGKGGMMVFDLSGAIAYGKPIKDLIIYERQIDNLCQDKTVDFNVYVGAINNSYPVANVALKLFDGKIGALGEELWSNQVTLNDGEWHRMGEEKFSMDRLTSNSAVLQIINLTEDYGNSQGDIAIDEISFSVCTPPDIDVEASLDKGDILKLCTDETLTLEAKISEAVENFYGSEIAYLFQVSNQNPLTTPDDQMEWKDLGTVQTSKTYDIVSPATSGLFDDVEDEVEIFFRVVVGKKSYLQTKRDEWSTMSPQSPCRVISISNIPVTAAKKCGKCIKPTAVDIKDVSDLSNKATTKLTLCPGDKLNLSADVTAQNESVPYDGYYLFWQKDGSDISGYSKLEYFTGGEGSPAKDVEVENDGSYTSPTVIEYSVIAVDTFEFKDLTSATCKEVGKVEVTFLPNPTETLTDPTTFCEGTLGENAEPTKTITGYDIQWYDGADTALTTTSKITTPVVGDVTKAQSPKSYWYVLTDKTTGCRGDANEYIITVDKADNNPTKDDIISYNKKDASNLDPMDQVADNFVDALAKSGYKFHIGRVDWPSTDGTTKPDLSTIPSSKLVEEVSTIPAPNVSNLDLNSTDDEYLWYYTYLEKNGTGCLSDTVLIKVIVKGAPSPNTKNGAYCLNSDEVKEIQEFASRADGTTGTLKFYQPDGTTLMGATEKPDVTRPGQFTYYATQTSDGGESSKQEIIITVYDVNKVKLAANPTYCWKESPVPNVETAASAIAGDAYTKQDNLEIFKDAAPTPNKQTHGGGGISSMEVSTQTPEATDYYVRYTYTIDESYRIENSDEVCYGDAEKYTVTVEKVKEPEVTKDIVYLLDEGKPGNGGFKLPTLREPGAIVGDATCSDCNIIWYDENKTSPIPESDATPTYDPMNTDNKTNSFWLRQENAVTGCKSDFVEIKITVSGVPAPITENINVCENDATKLTGKLTATAQPTTTEAASEYELVWYTSTDGGTTLTEASNGIDLSPSIQKANSDPNETKKVYTYWVLQRLIANPAKKSATSTVNITVYSNPKLKAKVTQPKCFGESQNLKEMYTSSIQQISPQYFDVSTNTYIPCPEIVQDSGYYQVKASYEAMTGLTCTSEYEDLKVVFHELKAEIIGADTICPNVGQIMDADVKVGGGLKEREVTYSWKIENSTISRTDNSKQFDTGIPGLEAPGDKMKVSLIVSSAACPNVKAKDKTITVGDGPIIGKILIKENNNSYSYTSEKPITKNMSFSSCGGTVEVELSGIVNKNGGSYTLSGDQSETGTFTSETAGSAKLKLNIPSGQDKATFMLSYTNECPTDFTIKINDASAKGEPWSSDMEICENQHWVAEIRNLEGPNNTVIEWQKDDLPISGETGTKLELNKAKHTDSGVYSFSLLSAGCRFDKKIGFGDRLEVKQYAVFDKTQIKDVYEVINGDPLNETIAFSTPSNNSEIENGVKWTGYSNPNGLTLNIPSVEKIYNIHIHAENNTYCPADTDIVVLVDARLKMEAKLDTTTMCVGEDHKLIIDTTGTGKVLHESNLSLTATETIGTGTPKPLNLKQDPKTGYVVAEISPEKDAVYDISYTYTTGSQSISAGPLNMKVYAAMNVDFAPVDSACGDGFESVSINVTPSSSVEELDWSKNSAEVTGNMNGATIIPVFNGTGVGPERRKITVIAKNRVCKPAEFSTTMIVSKPLEGEIHASSKICEFEPLILDASSYQAETYNWTYDEKGTEFTGARPTITPDPDFANFTLKMTRGKCKKEDFHTVEITTAPVISSIDSVTYKTVEIQVDKTGASEEYKYIIDGNESDPNLNESLRSDVAYGTHTLIVEDEVGCRTETTFIVNAPAIKIPILISPDDNGVNDKFVVEGLAAGYPDANVTIFDRWGKQLAKYKAGDGTDWDGVYNGAKMPSTDYWYEIQIKEIQKTYTGHFTLIRQ